MSNSLYRLFFPEVYRQVPHRRLLLSILRAMHILSFSIVVGGMFFNQANDFIFPWVMTVVISGILMFALDLFVSCVALFEIRGIAMLVKILLLLLIPITEGLLQISILFIVVIFSSIVSHTTRKIRHYNILPIKVQEKYGFNYDERNKAFSRNR